MKYLFVLMVWLSVACLADAQMPKDTAVTITVYGNCVQCKQRIETAVKGKGVAFASWDIDSKILSLVYNPSRTTLDKIQQRIVDAGHDTQFKKARDAAYNNLPSCCLYRNNETDEKSLDSLRWIPASEGNIIKGVVMETNSKGSFVPLAGASIYWLSGGKGVATDSTGIFAIQQHMPGGRLVITYTGYQADTVSVADKGALKIILASGGRLQDVTVTSSNNRSYYTSSLTAVRTQTMGEKELYKAACCNLSESFETNPSVDVSYNDAVTGSKQIQLLGLSGVYTQLTVENMPGPRGIATSNGLSLIPGPWIESIQLTKGTGSVANGYESIAGQINVEEKKPLTGERLFLNTYVNDQGKTDINLNLWQKVNSHWSTALLLHDDFLANKIDGNHDGFLDLPVGNQFNMLNRWKYDNGKGLMAQTGIKVVNDDRVGGQVGFNPAADKFTTMQYGVGLHTERYEAFGKLGYVFPEKKYKSIGLQASTFSHTQNDYFGLTAYNAQQQNFYANLIYQSIIGNTNHKFRAGISFAYDNYNETFNTANYKRKEAVPGAFFEYTWEASTKFNMVAGLRADNNSLYGAFVTPRLNARYQPYKNSTIRLSGGRGERIANIFAENLGWFASGRTVNILGGTNGAYGLKPEIAWNEGISIDQKFTLAAREGSIGVDFFRTDFTSQVVADVDKSASQINFYNLRGKSYSNSFQAELNYAVLKHVDVRLAYRLFDVKTTYHGELLQRPLVAKQRGFASVNYETANKWKFDYTVQAVGQKRLPYAGDNPTTYQWQNYSPVYVVMNVQVSKLLNAWDIYAGAEDLNNFYQKQLIVDAANPFSQYFDASIVWGPAFGRMFYAGVRYKIK